ncbi:unnamed protein product [Cladocopium goreaui]|uniref:J domain-containing protein n=1 Tax=Cladocopium goreaui TaxID=2562237 RepID=A0A9P1D946_9DINO|nr:unnamed protein product [Cladocopium goreaui]
MHLDISCASDPRAQTPEMSTMGPYTMRYKRSVHRVAGGSVSGSCCVNICQNKLLQFVLASRKSVDVVIQQEQRLGRFGASSDVWGRGLTDELERQWAEQEAQERRRVEDYARFRRRQFEEWERHFAAERLRFASEAEFCAAKLRQKARVAAAADEQFYASKRDTWHKSERALPEAEGDTNLAPEERQVMKELRSVLGAPRETQKAKVKDLLIRLHPDKNPGCTEKAKQLFQFLQEQLGGVENRDCIV